MSVGILMMASVIPADSDAIKEAATKGPILTVEDHHVDTGIGSIVGMVLAEEGIVTRFKRLGVTQYGSSGKPGDLYAEQGMDPVGIAAAFKRLI